MAKIASQFVPDTCTGIKYTTTDATISQIAEKFRHCAGIVLRSISKENARKTGAQAIERDRCSAVLRHGNEYSEQTPVLTENNVAINRPVTKSPKSTKIAFKGFIK